MFAASIASKAAAGFWSQNAQIAHAANAVIPATFLVFSFFLGLKLSLVLVSDSSPRWFFTDDDDTIDLGFVLFFLLAKLLRSEKEEEQNEFVEEHVDEKEENIFNNDTDACACVRRRIDTSEVFRCVGKELVWEKNHTKNVTYTHARTHAHARTHTARVVVVVVVIVVVVQ
jgi:hypothetical protein